MDVRLLQNHGMARAKRPPLEYLDYTTTTNGVPALTAKSKDCSQTGLDPFWVASVRQEVLPTVMRHTGFITFTVLPRRDWPTRTDRSPGTDARGRCGHRERLHPRGYHSLPCAKEPVHHTYTPTRVPHAR